MQNLKLILNFRYGGIDPWTSGGVPNTVNSAEAASRGVYVFHMDGAAHHLDLRGPNTCDPQSVISTRTRVLF